MGRKSSLLTTSALQPRWGTALLKPANTQTTAGQAGLKTSFYFSVCYKSRVLFLHRHECPDLVHRGFVFTVSLQDQGQVLLLCLTPRLPRAVQNEWANPPPLLPPPPALL